MGNTDPRYFHETIVRDIVDIATDIKDTKDDFDSDKILSKRSRSFRSVASATANLTLVFPVLISDSLSIESAGIIAKAIERKAASMMQMLFSALCIDDATNAIDYVKKFHNNLDTSNGITIDSLIDALDHYVVDRVDESASAIDKIEDLRKEIAKTKAFIEDMKNLNFTLPESVSEEGLNIYRFNHNSNVPMVFSEARRGGGGNNTNYNGNSVDYSDRSHQNNTFQSGSSYEVQHGSRVLGNGNINTTINQNKIFTGDNKSGKESSYKNDWDGRKSAAEYYNRQLIPTDVKKANELVPTMITVNFISNNKKGDPIAVEDVVLGIKAKLYPISSLDMINRIKIKNQDRNGFNKFIRATTREISFFKDFVFAIDKAKIDAVSQSRRGSSSKLWKVLERRGTKSRIRRTMRQTNDASAISTLVVSKEEVEYLKKTENINIEDPSVMRPIMESYNLMGVVLVDETQEVASFMFDSGDDMYEQLSFNNLEREATDGSSKKIINLMTKMAR